MNNLVRLIKAAIPSSIRFSRAGRVAEHLIRDHDSIYNEDYYRDVVEATSVSSAPVMASSMVRLFSPKTVVDVGCGSGALLVEFRKLSCRVFGLEYSDAGLGYCRKRLLPVRKFNIAHERIKDEQYELVVSFEVAEHLAPWIADRYVDLLTALSPLVIMSAATPGQGGTDHVNEQPRSYWVNKFAERGYHFDQVNAKVLATEWQTAKTATWYFMNVMVFRRSDRNVKTEVSRR